MYKAPAHSERFLYSSLQVILWRNLFVGYVYSIKNLNHHRMWPSQSISIIAWINERNAWSRHNISQPLPQYFSKYACSCYVSSCQLSFCHFAAPWIPQIAQCVWIWNARHPLRHFSLARETAWRRDSGTECRSGPMSSSWTMKSSQLTDMFWACRRCFVGLCASLAVEEFVWFTVIHHRWVF